ncbi:MAG: hypothetical protein LBM62_01935 [Mediterranea sp.]|jgi:AraC-like DNA-binding protein|nr:hypothetical protein [Mediterranea sp.]
MTTEFIAALFYSIIATSLLFSGMICLRHYLSADKKGPYRHILYSAFFSFSAICCWIEVLFIMMNLRIAVYLAMPTMLISLWAVVLNYHFIYLITGLGERLHFSPVHYLIPIAITLGLTLWGIPYSVTEKEQMLFSTDIFTNQTSLFAVVYSAFLFGFCIYNIIYTIPAYRRIHRYQKGIDDYSSNNERTSLTWVYFCWVQMVLSIGIPALSVLSVNFNIPTWMHIFLLWIPVTQVFLLYNITKGNYILALPTPAGEEQMRNVLTRYRFERYMEEKKPYVNPDLCITDMLAELCTNRTYLSNFINREYGVNFKTLINDYRLKELDRLRLSSLKQPQRTKELLKAAGFSSYRNYVLANERKYKQHRLSPL